MVFRIIPTLCLTCTSACPPLEGGASQNMLNIIKHGILSPMDEVVKHILLFIGKALAPFAIVIALASPGTLPSSIIPTPTNTPTPTPTLTPTPTNTPTPTPSPSPKPTPTPTPKPSPTPTPQPISGSQIDEWFTKYANHYSVDRTKLKNVAVCESGLRANAVNGPYGGMFQFHTDTWVNTRKAMSLDTNPDLRFNPEEAIRTAAFKTSITGFASWPSCSK